VFGASALIADLRFARRNDPYQEGRHPRYHREVEDAFILGCLKRCDARGRHAWADSIGAGC
jgi:hypothetical protein